MSIMDRRRSSLGTRRGPPRKHIPFRADDPGRGKKTGVAVAYVDRNSDEFEPFDQVIKQADDTQPPRRKKRISATEEEEEEEEGYYGEMSMDLAESYQGSPLAYFTNSNHVYATDIARRPIVSRSMRQFDIDYDQIPSPKSYLSARHNMRGPSALSKSFAPRDPTPDPDADFDLPQLDDNPSRTPTPEATPNDAEEEEEEEEEETVAQYPKLDKGKQRAVPVEEVDLEDDIAQGLEDVENAQDDEDNVPPAKKPRKETKPRKPRAEKRVVTPVERSPTPEGVRRGRRHRFKPLEWWRQEKVVYGRRDPGMILVPQIKEIIRIPQEPPRPLGKAAKRKRGAPGRAKSKGRDTPFNPEEGWDANTSSNATVIDYVTQEEVLRRVAFTVDKIKPKPAANNSWFFQKIFGEGDFIAAGQINIPPKCSKPSKTTKDNAYIFYVIQGAVSVVVHETNFVIATGGMFLVPRGNTYFIENIAERDAKLFFTQARKIPAEEMQISHTAQSAPPVSARRAISESTSAGPRTNTRKT